MDLPIKEIPKKDEQVSYEETKPETVSIVPVEVKESICPYVLSMESKALQLQNAYPILEIDYDHPDIIVYKSKETKVNKKQFQLINLLVKSPSSCVFYPVITNQIWGYLSCISQEQIKYHKSQLLSGIKKTHPADPDVNKLILTVPKEGLKLNLKKENVKINGVELSEFGKRDLSQFNRRQMQVYRKMRSENLKITTAQYCQMFGITKRTALRDLRQLLKKKLIAKHGRGKAVFYVYKGMSRLGVP